MYRRVGRTDYSAAKASIESSPDTVPDSTGSGSNVHSASGGTLTLAWFRKGVEVYEETCFSDMAGLSGVGDDASEPKAGEVDEKSVYRDNCLDTVFVRTSVVLPASVTLVYGQGSGLGQAQPAAGGSGAPVYLSLDRAIPTLGDINSSGGLSKGANASGSSDSDAKDSSGEGVAVATAEAEGAGVTVDAGGKGSEVVSEVDHAPVGEEAGSRLRTVEAHTKMR